MGESGTNLRYVVLRHEGVPQPHFDFMVELSPGAPLATWRAEHWPPQPGQTLERLPDHRQAYLVYEGPVSRNRGHVHRVAEGTCNVTGTDSDRWTVQLDNKKKLRLRQSSTDGTLWQVLT